MSHARPLSHQQVQGRRTCKLCQLKLGDPARVEQIEVRLALGEHILKLAHEYGLPRHSITRHWKNHCDQREVLRRAHKKDREADVEELIVRGELSGLGPMVIADRQIACYVREFEDCRKRNDREARDAADRRLFVWCHLKHRMLQPLAQQYGPQQLNVQNNVVVGAGADFALLVQKMEQQLAGRPPAERRQFIGLLRAVASPEQGDAAPLIELDDAAE
jgi:hypothetical protein